MEKDYIIGSREHILSEPDLKQQYEELKKQINTDMVGTAQNLLWLKMIGTVALEDVDSVYKYKDGYPELAVNQLMWFAYNAGKNAIDYKSRFESLEKEMEKMVKDIEKAISGYIK